MMPIITKPLDLAKSLTVNTLLLSDPLVLSKGRREYTKGVGIKMINRIIRQMEENNARLLVPYIVYK